MASVSVIAPRSADADALATAFNVLPPEESLRLAESLKDVECLIVTRDNDILTSSGWDRFEAGAQAPLLAFADEPKPAGARPASSGATTRAGGELHDQPARASRRYRRPYVALWISDAEGKPVRYLILWVSMGGSGPIDGCRT